MKKILIFLLVLPICLTFAACGENDGQSDDQSSQTISQPAEDDTVSKKK